MSFAGASVSSIRTPQVIGHKVFESFNTFLTYPWLRQTGQQHSSSSFQDKQPPAYPAYSAFIRHCPFRYNILNDIKDHSASSRNRNRGNMGNIKSQQRGPSRLRLCFLQLDLSLAEIAAAMSDSSCARQRTRSSTFIVSESLFPIRSHGEYYLKVLLRVLVESTSRVSPTHYPRWHSCKSQLAKRESQPANTKVSRRSSHTHTHTTYSLTDSPIHIHRVVDIACLDDRRLTFVLAGWDLLFTGWDLHGCHLG